MCHEQMGNLNKGVDILRNNQMKMLEMEMKPFDAFISRLNTYEKSVDLKIG